MKAPFALFCDAQWVWVTIGMGGTMRAGIDRAGLEASARLLGIPMTPSIYADVRTLENYAMEYWARKH